MWCHGTSFANEWNSQVKYSSSNWHQCLFSFIRYMEIPLISRLYLTGAFLTTAACAVELISPFSLYFNWDLVFQGQVWRLLTSYLFFGVFSIDFLFHMYFLVSTSWFSINLMYCWLFRSTNPITIVVLTGPIQPFVGRRWFPGENGKLCTDAPVWNPLHFTSRSLHTCTLSGKCLDIHDGICMGTTQWRCKNELFGILSIQCSLLAMGHVGL